MKNDPTYWLLARASGLVAYAILTASVLAGLVLEGAPAGAVGQPGGDRRHPSLPRAARPRGSGDSRHRPRARRRGRHRSRRAPRRAPPLPAAARNCAGCPGRGADGARLRPSTSQALQKAWRALHWFTYLVFALATLHGLAAGTDSGRPGARALRRCRRRGSPPSRRLLVPPTQGVPNMYRLEIDRSLCSGFGLRGQRRALPPRRRRHRRRGRRRVRRSGRPRRRPCMPNGRDLVLDEQGRGRMTFPGRPDRGRRPRSSVAPRRPRRRASTARSSSRAPRPPPYERPVALEGGPRRPPRPGPPAPGRVLAREGHRPSRRDPHPPDRLPRRIARTDADSIRWDALVLATGACPRCISLDGRRGVHVLRTLDDARALGSDLAPGGDSPSSAPGSWAPKSRRPPSRSEATSA